MTSTTEEEILLKTDSIGRVRMPDDKREMILDRFEESGMSGQAFAAHIGVKYQTFATWVQKRRKLRGDYPNASCKEVKASLTLVEAIVDHQKPDLEQGSLEVETISGLKIRLSRSQEIPLAVELIKVLVDAKL